MKADVFIRTLLIPIKAKDENKLNTIPVHLRTFDH